MQRYKITLEHNRQLFTITIRAISRAAAELAAKQHAIATIDPQQNMWPPVQHTLRITSTVPIK